MAPPVIHNPITPAPAPQCAPHEWEPMSVLEPMQTSVDQYTADAGAAVLSVSPAIIVSREGSIDEASIGTFAFVVTAAMLQRLAPGHAAQIYYRLGKRFRQKGRDIRAVRMYQRAAMAFERSGQPVQAVLARGDTAFLRGDYTKSIHEIRQAMKIAGETDMPLESALALNAPLGRAYRASGDQWERGGEGFGTEDVRVSRHTKAAVAYGQAAQAYERLGTEDGAERARECRQLRVDSVLKARPGEVPALQSFAASERARGAAMVFEAEAREFARQAAEADPEAAAGLYGEAVGYYQRAAQLYLAAGIPLVKREAAMHMEAGRLLLQQLDRPSEAAVEFGAARDLSGVGPEYEAAIEGRCHALMALAGMVHRGEAVAELDAYGLLELALEEAKGSDVAGMKVRIGRAIWAFKDVLQQGAKRYAEGEGARLVELVHRMEAESANREVARAFDRAIREWAARQGLSGDGELATALSDPENRSRRLLVDQGISETVLAGVGERLRSGSIEAPRVEADRDRNKSKPRVK